MYAKKAKWMERWPSQTMYYNWIIGQALLRPGHVTLYTKDTEHKSFKLKQERRTF